MKLNSILNKNEWSSIIVDKEGLINPFIIYDFPKNVNKYEKNNFDMLNLNMNDSSKKGIANLNLKNAITTEVGNQIRSEAELDDKTLSIEKTFSLPRRLSKDCEIKSTEILKKDNKIENKEFSNKKRKPNKKEVQYLDSDSKIKKIRILILNSIIIFINKQIKLVFNNDIGKGIFKKQLLPINKTFLYHSSI